LMRLKRFSEAAFFARTYCPSLLSSALAQWKKELGKTNRPVADSLGDPTRFPNLFPNLDVALKAEADLSVERHSYTSIEDLPPATDWVKRKGEMVADLLTSFKEAVSDSAEESQ